MKKRLILNLLKIIILFSLLSSFASSALTDGLARHWAFDEGSGTPAAEPGKEGAGITQEKNLIIVGIISAIFIAVVLIVLLMIRAARKRIALRSKSDDFMPVRRPAVEIGKF